MVGNFSDTAVKNPVGSNFKISKLLYLFKCLTFCETLRMKPLSHCLLLSDFVSLFEMILNEI